MLNETKEINYSGGSAQLQHLILFLYTIQTTFQNYFFHLNLFSNKKLGIATSFAPVKIDLSLS